MTYDTRIRLSIVVSSRGNRLAWHDGHRWR